MVTLGLVALAGMPVAYFHIPDCDTLIDCVPSCVSASHPPRHAPITMGEYRAARFARTANVA